MRIFDDFTFESAHLLPNLPDDHKCRRLHGHSFRVTVTVEGPIDPTTGWVMDFAQVEAACEPVRQALDHRYLNDIEGLANPTSETIARWIWRRLKPALPQLAEIKLWETCTAGCVYQGEEG